MTLRSHFVLCRQIDIRYATIVESDFTIRVHLVGFFIATVSYHSSFGVTVYSGTNTEVKCMLEQYL